MALKKSIQARHNKPVQCDVAPKAKTGISLRFILTACCLFMAVLVMYV